MVQQLEAIHQTHHLRHLQSAHRAAGKGKSRGKGKERAPDIDVVQYDGLDNECSICQDQLHRGDIVYRVTCNHLFHEDCWKNFIQHDRNVRTQCPTCRGPAATKAKFRYLGGTDHPAASVAEADTLFHAANTPPTVMIESEQHLTPQMLTEYAASWSSLSLQDYFSMKDGQMCPKT